MIPHDQPPTSKNVAVNNPRATDGDDRYEPSWDERLSIRIGQHHGDIVGTDDKAIQAAIDYVAGQGGGTVHILPGIYILRASIHLPTGIRLLGSGADSVLTKTPSERVALSTESDWYDQEITLAQAGNFRVGDSVVLEAKNPHNDSAVVIKRRLLARSGNRFKLDNGLRDNLWQAGNPTCASLFPLLTSDYTENVLIENLTLDGNKENNENYNGNYGGCIFLQDCKRYTIRNVEARNYNGDGISFQICHDIVIEDCYSHDNADLGVHPGSGSQRPIIIGNRLERNSQGLFWCWGVKHGLAAYNKIIDNKRYGSSIGHNDTDNVMRDNEIIGSGQVGILFRNEDRGQDFWPNRNTIQRNRIINSGGPEGIAIDIQGQTKDLVITNNEIQENREALNRTAIRIAATAGTMTLHENAISGFSQAVVDQRQP